MQPNICVMVHIMFNFCAFLGMIFANRLPKCDGNCMSMIISPHEVKTLSIIYFIERRKSFHASQHSSCEQKF